MNRLRHQRCTTSFIAFCGLVCGLIAGSAHAESGDVVWHDVAYREVRDLNAYPAAVQTALCVRCTGTGGIAQPKGPFNPTDVILHDAPMRRLVVGGVSDSSSIAVIEHGGYAYYVQVTQFDNKTGASKVLGHWDARQRKKPQSLQEALQKMEPAIPGSR